MGAAKVFQVPVKNKATGEILSQVEVGELIHRKPIVEFEYMGAVFAMQVDPLAITSETNHAVQAALLELRRVSEVRGEKSPSVKQAVRQAQVAMAAASEDQRARVIAAVADLDNAYNKRIVASVMRDKDSGDTLWNYAGQLTLQLLEGNAPLADAISAGWDKWSDPTSLSFAESGKTKPASGAPPPTNTSVGAPSASPAVPAL